MSQQSPKKSAFTLVEMVTSMAIIGILILVIGTALSFSIKTTAGQGAVNQTNLLAAGDAADQMADDMHVALTFSERTGTSVAFSVPDRVSNGTPNQVRYAWDGVSGDPLTRQFSPTNATILTASSSTYTPTTLLAGVTNFDVNYLTRSMGMTAATPFVIASPGTALLGTAQTYNVDSTHWFSQYFTPILPLGATSYTITSVQIYMKTGAAQDGTLSVSISASNGSHKPQSNLETEPLYESAASSGYEYVSVNFKNLKNLSLATYPGLCIVVQYTSGTSPVGTVQYQTSLLNILSGAYWSTSSNAGSTWSSASSLSCLQFNVNGTTP
jgi:prepilin-type N-terminal cleavage/methylation domain-containing protein